MNLGPNWRCSYSKERKESPFFGVLWFIGLAYYYQGKDIVFRFVIEYSSLKDFDPYVVDLFLYEDFWNMIFWLVLKLEIS
jgi:hypothetical protein